MSMYEYTVADAECDMCERKLSDVNGEIISLSEVRRMVELFGWVEVHGEVLCDKCKHL